MTGHWCEWFVLATVGFAAGWVAAVIDAILLRRQIKRLFEKFRQG